MHGQKNVKLGNRNILTTGILELDGLFITVALLPKSGPGRLIVEFSNHTQTHTHTHSR